MFLHVIRHRLFVSGTVLKCILWGDMRSACHTPHNDCNLLTEVESARFLFCNILWADMLRPCKHLVHQNIFRSLSVFIILMSAESQREFPDFHSQAPLPQGPSPNLIISMHIPENYLLQCLLSSALSAHSPSHSCLRRSGQWVFVEDPNLPIAANAQRWMCLVWISGWWVLFTGRVVTLDSIRGFVTGWYAFSAPLPLSFSFWYLSWQTLKGALQQPKFIMWCLCQQHEATWDPASCPSFLHLYEINIFSRIRCFRSPRAPKGS